MFFTLLVNWLDQDENCLLIVKLRSFIWATPLQRFLSYLNHQFLNNLVSSQGHDEQSTNSSNIRTCSSLLFILCLKREMTPAVYIPKTVCCKLCHIQSVEGLISFNSKAFLLVLIVQRTYLRCFNSHAD